jgi:hypothetical protein
MTVIRRPRMVAALVALGLCVAAPGAAHGAASWNSGALQESTITDCGSIIFGNPTQVAGLGTYVSVYEDYNAPVTANQGYYIAVDVYGIGNACSGQAVDIGVSLPANTVPNISAATPVHCIPLQTVNNQVVNGQPDTSAGCPQAPTSTSGGVLHFDMPVKTGFFATMFSPLWGIPVGSGIEMQIPVVSSAAITSQLTGVIQVADGNSGPTLRPTVPVFVNPSPSQTPPVSPTFAVNNPAASNITNTSATLTATFVIDNDSHPSAVDFNVGATANNYTFPSTEQSLDYVAGGVPYEDQRSQNETALQPGCTYHWQAVLRGAALTGPPGTVNLAQTSDQTFTTTGTSNGTCVVGLGGSGGTGVQGPVQQLQPLNPATAQTIKFTPAPAPPSAPPATTTTQTTPAPPPPPPPSDRVTKLSVAAKTITEGKPLTVNVTLAAAGKVTIIVVRHVPASGHGKHRRKAHDVTIGTKTFTGNVGLNALKLTALNGHQLVPGSYTAKVTSGNKTHTINFTVKAPAKRHHGR